MKKLLTTVLCLGVILASFSVCAKLKTVEKPDKGYDFKAVKKIVVQTITSNNTDFGKLDPDRKPKIDAILKKTKENLYKSIIKGAKNAKSTIAFVEKGSKKEPSTTLIMELNFDKFDNGNAVTRNVPFAGKAKVELRATFRDASTKKVVSEVVSESKAKGGFVMGGLDSEVLWSASNMCLGEIFGHLKKLTGFDYSFWSGVTQGLKDGTKGTADVLKEEKGEADTLKKKTKK